MALMYDPIPILTHSDAIVCLGGINAGSTILELVDTKILVGLIIALLLLIGLLLVRLAAKIKTEHPMQANLPVTHVSGENREMPETPAKPISSGRGRPANIATTEKDVRPVIPIPETSKLRDDLSSRDIRREEQINPARALEMWQLIGRWPEVGRLHQKLGDQEKAAEIYLAIDRRDKALPLLRQSLKDAPGNEKLRLRLIETLFDEGIMDEAFALIEAVEGQDTPIKVSAEFFAKIGRRLEAIHLKEQAEFYYKLAILKQDNLDEVHLRLLFLGQMRRLRTFGENGTEKPITSPAREFLNRFTYESSLGDMKFDELDKSAKDRTSMSARHEIIVGHLVLGFQQEEPAYSVRSKFSIARRFALDKLLTEAPRSSVFLARDLLLDSPVALKLYRLDDDFTELEVLRQRLVAIAQLNHPNLGKVTFVDRDGPIIRMATEYLPGGNLRDYLNNLGGVGLPLILRLAMHITSALHAAHQKGVPHGDIRMENMIIGQDQRLKLIDFALSTMPVLAIDDEDLDIGDSVSGLLENDSESALVAEAVQSDLLQFADVLEIMLQYTRKESDPSRAASAEESQRDLRELVSRIRSGSFTSILRLWQIIHEIYERNLPATRSSDTQRA